MVKLKKKGTDDRDAVVVFQLVNIKCVSPQNSKALSCVENAEF